MRRRVRESEGGWYVVDGLRLALRVAVVVVAGAVGGLLGAVVTVPMGLVVPELYVVAVVPVVAGLLASGLAHGAAAMLGRRDAGRRPARFGGVAGPVLVVAVVMGGLGMAALLTGWGPALRWVALWTVAGGLLVGLVAGVLAARAPVAGG